jgi:alpha-soluble NSF attachment protein
MRCIDCSSEHDQAPFYLEAAHCQKKVSLKGFIELAEMAINQYCLKGSISSAASLAKEIAESLEEEYDYEESARFFEKTADLYHMEESVT